MYHSILNSPLTSLDVHQIDLVFPCFNATIPILNSVKGSDVIQLINNYGFNNYVICRNSNKVADFYDLLYCGNPPEPQLLNMMDPTLPPFLTSPISLFFTPTKIITSKYQRMALFVFTLTDYYDMLVFRFNQKQINSPFKMRSLFRKPDIQTFLIRLPTNLTISIKLPITSTVLELRNKAYEKIRQIYSDSNICNINFFKLISTLKDYSNPKLITYRVPDLNRQLNNDPVILDCLKSQNKYPNQAFLFFEVCPIISNFDKTVFQLTKELDLCPLASNDEINLFNMDMSLIRTEITLNQIKMMKENPLMARMMISDSEPFIPTKKIDDQYVYMKADISTGSENTNIDLNQVKYSMASSLQQTNQISQPSVSMMAITIKVNYDMTANQAIQMFLEKLRSMRRNTRLSETPNQQNQQNQNQQQNQSKPKKIKKIINQPIPGLKTTRQIVIYTDATDDDINDNSNFTSNDVDDPNNYVLTIGSMDDILTGDIPIVHFTSVRHFIVSGQQILSVNLKEKTDVIKYIHETQINKISNQIEIKPEMVTKPIIINKYQGKKEDDQGYVPHFNIKLFPKIEIFHVLGINAPYPGQYYIKACLIYGLKLLCKPVQTKIVQGRTTLLFEEILTLPILLSNIPREAKLSITLYRYISQNQSEAVATSNSALYKFTGWLENGYKIKKMWKNRDLDFFLTTCESNEDKPIIISFNHPNYSIPVYYIPPKIPDDFHSRATLTVPITEKQRIEKLRNKDSLTPLTNEDKKALWNYRSYCFMYPELLSSMLESIDYSDPEQVEEIPLLLANWNRPSGIQALSLLDVKYANTEVRSYAVKCLAELNDTEVLLYLLQLVQALKYELYENSLLAQFLIRRGLTEPRFIGHQLFWQLMSEAHLSNVRARISLMIVNLMYGIGSYREELIKGFKFTQELVKLNQILLSTKHQDIQEPFREALKKIEIPKEFHLPVDSRLVVDSFIIDKCKVMDSKKKPFFLVFKNAAPFATAPITTMFKVGDDLRQDQLVLQLMKVMENLWRKENLDLEMRIYGVLPTGLNQGFIEVVPNAITEKNLQPKSSIPHENSYIDYLKSKNPTLQQFEIARRNFLLSSAGYAVSTCVLGVTDRHTDNLMVQEDGHFFHIDYGHFLGNFKKIKNIQTENAPIHFINSYVQMLDGKDSLYFEYFLSYACKAFNILRKNGRLLIDLLVMMIGTGIPELQKLDDIKYFKDMLFLNLNDDEASEKFKELINVSLNSWRTFIRDFFHNWTH